MRDVHKTEMNRTAKIVAVKFKEIREAIAGAALIAFHILLSPLFRRWRVKWRASEDEIRRAFRGDKLIPNPKWSYTPAGAIKAPINKVWPWIVQIGQGRGGFYSYELLENIIGCNIHNMDRIIPEFQKLG